MRCTTALIFLAVIAFLACLAVQAPQACAQQENATETGFGAETALTLQFVETSPSSEAVDVQVSERIDMPEHPLPKTDDEPSRVFAAAWICIAAASACALFCTYRRRKGDNDVL